MRTEMKPSFVGMWRERAAGNKTHEKLRILEKAVLNVRCKDKLTTIRFPNVNSKCVQLAVIS
jgi:hypothetical protein